MQHQVTSYFIDAILALKEKYQSMSYRQMAHSLDIHAQCLSDIVNGKRNVTIDSLNKLSENYHVSPSYLLTGRGSMFADEAPKQENLGTSLTGNITYIPVAAQAGYGGNLHEVLGDQELPTFTLPGYEYKTGDHRCFDISGDSMEPTLFNQDRVVCSQVEKEFWHSKIRNGLVYIIVTDDSVYAKRVINNIISDQQIELHSDNSYYDVQLLDVEEIREIWQVDITISNFNASPNSVKKGLHDQVESLKSLVDSQTGIIQKLHGSMEQLIKQNRVSR